MQLQLKALHAVLAVMIFASSGVGRPADPDRSEGALSVWLIELQRQ